MGTHDLPHMDGGLQHRVQRVEFLEQEPRSLYRALYMPFRLLLAIYIDPDIGSRFCEVFDSYPRRVCRVYSILVGEGDDVQHSLDSHLAKSTLALTK
jgi:hypothetical protein